MKKFCCSKFQFLFTGEKTSGLNIRIIKLNKEFVKRGQLDFDKSFMITEGYVGNINDCKKKIAIKHCPFCGSDLRKWYSDEDYVQEIMEP